MATGFDLASVLGEVANRMNAVAGEAQGINAAYGGQLGAINSQSAAVNALGEANKIVQSQASKGALEAQANTQRAATALGTNMNDPSQIITTLGDIFRTSALEMQAAQAKVTKIESQATLGNPLGLVYDAFFGDEARAELQGKQAQTETAAANLSRAFTLTQEAARTNAATANNLSIAGEEARLQAIDAETKLKQGELAYRAAGVNVSRLQAMQSQNEQQLNLMIKGMQLQDAADQRAYMNELRDEARAQRNAARADDELGLQLYNLGRQAQGLPQVDLPFYRTQQKIGKPDLLTTMQLGERLFGKEQGDWAKVPVGVNAVDSLATIMDLGLPMSQGEQQMAATMTQAFADAADPKRLMAELNMDMQSAAAIATDKKKRAEVAQQLIEKRANLELSQLRPSDKSGLYKVPDLGAIKDTAAMSTNPFLARVVKPLAEVNATLDANVIMEQAAGLVAKGELNSSDVTAGMQYIANQLAGMMHESNNYSRYRLPSPLTEGFRVSISNGTGILKGSQSKIVNLMDPTEVNEALARSLGSLNLINRSNFAPGIFSTIQRALDRNNIQSIMNDPAISR